MLSASPALSIPSGLNAFQNGVVAVPVRVDQLSDGLGNTGLSTADLAIDFDPSVFTVSGGDIFQGTAPVSAASLLSFNTTFASGQLRISITDPTAAISIGRRHGRRAHYHHHLGRFAGRPEFVRRGAHIGCYGVRRRQRHLRDHGGRLNHFTLNGTNGDCRVGQRRDLGPGNRRRRARRQPVAPPTIAWRSSIFTSRAVRRRARTPISLVASNSLGATDMSAANGS